MKKKKIKFLGIFLVGLVVVSSSGCISEENGNEAEAIPLSGWLFNIHTLSGEEFYLVAKIFDEKTHSYLHVIVDQNQIKEITKLSNIVPIDEKKLKDVNCSEIAMEELSKLSDECYKHLSVGEPLLTTYHYYSGKDCKEKGELRPYIWYLPLYYGNEYYGWVGIDDREGYIATMFEKCSQVPNLSGLTQEEVEERTKEFNERLQIPSDTLAKEILLEYLKNDGIEGTIIKSYLVSYLVQDLDSFRELTKTKEG